MSHDDLEPDDDYDEAEHLAQVRLRLREKRGELALTIRAIQRKERTPARVRSVIDTARRLIYQARLLQRQRQQERQVH
jgi:hypothetical protein